MEELAVFKSFGKGEKLSIVRSDLCVVYTRVSSKDQTENLSLATQRKGCIQYAERHKLTIVKNFGATNESATTDERAEFKAMIDFVKKSRQKISYILCYSLERFSRNDNAIWLTNQLRKLGIEIVSVTQPIDTSNPSGKMQQKLLYLFGEFDNELRKQKCNAGIREMLLQGDWPTKPPLGYDSVKINGKRTIVINAKGGVLRKAFEWKAQENLTDQAIRERLATHGIALCHQGARVRHGDLVAVAFAQRPKPARFRAARGHRGGLGHADQVECQVAVWGLLGSAHGPHPITSAPAASKADQRALRCPEPPGASVRQYFQP